VHLRACVRPPSSPVAAVAARERRRRARELRSDRHLCWRPRCNTGGRTCMSARVFSAAVVVGGRNGTVFACALLLAAVFLCGRLRYTTVHGRVCGGRRGASLVWQPLCAQVAAVRSLSTRRRTVRGPDSSATWFFARRVRSQKRSAGAVCGSCAVCADAR